MIGLLPAYDAMALPALIDPYTGSDCGIHSGNDQDFTGSYLGFALGYVVLLLAIYIIAIVNLVMQMTGLVHRRFTK